MSFRTTDSARGDKYAEVELHELAKGWKAAVSRATDPAFRHEARIKNDRGNLPLHSACSFRAPIEVTEALLEAYPEASSMANNYGNLSLHFAAWKKGPLDVIKLLLKVFPEGAAQKNNHGNLPLHYAAHYNAPLEIVEALYHAFPEGAHQKNNDSNTPLDLAIADGASPNVVALLQGKPVPPSEEELYESAKARCERMEKELQRTMEGHDGTQSELELVLSLLLEVKQGHAHALYCSGIDPSKVTDLESLLVQIRRSGEESRAPPMDGTSMAINAEDASFGRQSHSNSVATPHANSNVITDDEEDELQAVEDALVPPDDEVEKLLAKIVGLESVKNQIRGIRRTIELDKLNHNSSNKYGSSMVPYRQLPRHIALIGNPGSGKTHVGHILLKILQKIGAVPTPNALEVGRDDLVDKKSEKRTIAKVRAVLERASGGVLLVDEAYTLLPCPARPRGRDFGPVALRELARGLSISGNGSSGGPLVLLVGYSAELQKVLASEVGFRGNFLTKIEFPDPSVTDIARMFFLKLLEKGLIPADGLTVSYVAQLLEQNTQEDWRADRNGRIADLLFTAVRNEMKHRSLGGDVHSRESVSPKRLLPATGHRLPVNAAEEVVVTLEDVQHAVMAGL